MKILLKNKKLAVRRGCLVLLDAICANLSVFLALATRFEFVISDIPPEFIAVYRQHALFMTVMTVVILAIFRIYSSLWEYAGAQEAVNLILACLAIGILHLLEILLRGDYMPRSYWLLYPLFLLLLIGFTRFSYRQIRIGIHNKNNHAQDSCPRVMIIGAGSAGCILIQEIRSSSYVNMDLKCIVDDDKRKVGRFIHGVKVEGSRKDIPALVEKYRIERIIVALPSLSRRQLKPILQICQNTGCEVQILPGVYQLVNEEVSVSRLRKVEIEDLLGREPVSVDIQKILDYVQGRVIMVTGGGGSIGSELCRQIAGHSPKQLIIVDIYENNAYDIQNELLRKYPDLNLVVLIASVRDEKRIDTIFDTYRPEIVYHAAAHKHVPLMEVSPNEAIKNNVGGTLNMVMAANRWHVKRFVMISTDKAVNPTNIMGASKRICEMIIQSYNRNSDTDFVAVRFGNVLGSNGSVIPLFKKQIEEGGPVTVTHPDIIRYFMTIPEAVSLVLQAGAFARGGEIFVLDMGEPVKILDLAKNMITLSGYKVDEDIKIVFTGLRPGEKLYEELLMNEEGLKSTSNKLIHIGKPIEFDEKAFYLQLDQLLEAACQETDEMKQMVKELVPTYHVDGKVE